MVVGIGVKEWIFLNATFRFLIDYLLALLKDIVMVILQRKTMTKSAQYATTRATYHLLSSHNSIKTIRGKPSVLIINGYYL